MLFRSFKTVLRYALRNIKSNLRSFIFSVLMIAVSLFGLGLFLTTYFNVEKNTQHLWDSLYLVAFSNVENQADALLLKEKLQKNPQIQNIVLLSPTEAFQELQSQLDNDLKLDPNFVQMPWVLKIESQLTELKGQLANQQQQEQQLSLKETILENQQIDDVLSPPFENTHLIALRSLIVKTGYFLILIVSLLILFMISHTIRMTLFSRKEEIDIMKLVGATNAFVRTPYLVEAGLQGLLASLLAILLMNLLGQLWLFQVSQTFDAFFDASNLSLFPLKVSLIIIVVGVSLSFLASVWAMQGFLRDKEQ